MNEQEVRAALRRRYGRESMGARRYAVADEVPLSTSGWARIADFIAVDCWRGRDDWPIHGHEIKVSRSDWLRELRDPSKAEAWARYCRRWWLVVGDASIVRPEELPPTWGLLVPRGGRLTAVVPAARRKPEPLPWATSAALMRAVQRTALIRGDGINGSERVETPQEVPGASLPICAEDALQYERDDAIRAGEATRAP